MGVRVVIVQGPLDRGDPASNHAGAGGVLVFDGVVRPDEEGQQIAALRYEVYQPMAQQMLERIANEILQQEDLLELEVWHSEGVVPVGECSLRVRIASAHRAEALRAMEAFIDRLKRDVPIWKHVVEPTG